MGRCGRRGSWSGAELRARHEFGRGRGGGGEEGATEAVARGVQGGDADRRRHLPEPQRHAVRERHFLRLRGRRWCRGGHGPDHVALSPDVAFTKKQIKAAKGATFPKLGDAAAESITPGGGGDIQILKGKVLLDVSARKSDSAGKVIDLDPTAFAAFAKAALAKMTSGGSSSSATPRRPLRGAGGRGTRSVPVADAREVATVLGGTVTADKAGPQDCEFTNNGGKLIHVAVSIGTPKYETDAKNFTGTARQRNR